MEPLWRLAVAAASTVAAAGSATTIPAMISAAPLHAVALSRSPASQKPKSARSRHSRDTGAGQARRLLDALGVRNPRPEQSARAEGVVAAIFRDVFRVTHTSATKDITLKLERLYREQGDEEMCRKLHAIRRGQNRDLKKMREESE
jgi:hypothetical protein